MIKPDNYLGFLYKQHKKKKAVKHKSSVNTHNAFFFLKDVIRESGPQKWNNIKYNQLCFMNFCSKVYSKHF